MSLLTSFWKLRKHQITQREHEQRVREAKPMSPIAAKAADALYPALLWFHRQRSRHRKTPYDDRVSAERLADHYRSRDPAAVNG